MSDLESKRLVEMRIIALITICFVSGEPSYLRTLLITVPGK